jgi:hypothetical protein
MFIDIFTPDRFYPRILAGLVSVTPVTDLQDVLGRCVKPGVLGVPIPQTKFTSVITNIVDE